MNLKMHKIKNFKEFDRVGMFLFIPIKVNPLYIFLKIFLIAEILLHACNTLLIKSVFPKLCKPHKPFVLFQWTFGFVNSVLAIFVNKNNKT